MVKVLFAIIGVWSALCFFTCLVDWINWFPSDETFGSAVQSIIKYRIKMAFKMIVPGILLLISVFAILS